MLWDLRWWEGVRPVRRDHTDGELGDAISEGAWPCIISQQRIIIFSKNLVLYEIEVYVKRYFKYMCITHNDKFSM